MQRRFAILVPSFDSAATIAETLDSIQRQTELGCIDHVMLCDDGSADDTVAVAQACWNADARLPLRIRTARHGGECANVNSAVAELSPIIEWLFILHSDDIAKPNWISTMSRIADTASDSVGSITASWDVLQPDGRVVAGERESGCEAIVIPANDSSIRNWVIDGCWWKITSCCIRREVFLALGGLDASFLQMYDVDFVLRMLSAGYDVLYVPSSLSLYRVHDRSVTSNNQRLYNDLRDDLKLLRRYSPCLLPHERRDGYYRRAHATTSRVFSALRGRQFRRAASAAGIGVSLARSYLLDIMGAA